MIQPDYKQMTRAELREYMLAHRDDEQAFHTYMDKVQQEAVKNPINDEVIADPQKFATFIEQNKQRKQQEATVQPTNSFSQNFHGNMVSLVMSQEIKSLTPSNKASQVPQWKSKLF